MRSERGYRGILLALLAPSAALALLALWQMGRQRFAVDELTYLHGAWALSKGELPYRDFFFHHTPLLLQLLAPGFRVLGDDPTRILWMRWTMLVPLAATAWASARLNRSLGRLEAWLTAGFFFLLWPFVASAVEIRPDNLALALFLTALVALPGNGEIRHRARHPVWRGAAAGFLLGTAVWASEKTLVYGSVFALGFLVDLVRFFGSRRGRGSLLGHPLAFLGGFLSAAVCALGDLSPTGSLGSFWHWVVEWSLIHERYYPGFSWRIYAAPFLRGYGWLLPVALLGLATSVVDLVHNPERWKSRDLLLCPALATTLLSFTLQTAPYPYSLVPFLALFSVFTVRGGMVLLRALTGALDSPHRGRRGMAALALGASFLVALGIATMAAIHLVELPGNRSQLDRQARLATLTRPEDPVFDAAGRYVTRPHVSFFYFNDDTVRIVLPDRLTRDVTEGILATGCTVAMRDRQWVFFPEKLQDFLYLHFQPADEAKTFWIWGRPFVRRESGREGRRFGGPFVAVRTGRYFVEPREVLTQGRLEVDGRRIREPVFELERGLRRVVFEGDASSFYILWLPRDGRRFHPVSGAGSVFWPLHHRLPPAYLGLEEPPESVVAAGEKR